MILAQYYLIIIPIYPSAPLPLYPSPNCASQPSEVGGIAGGDGQCNYFRDLVGMKLPDCGSNCFKSLHGRFNEEEEFLVIAFLSFPAIYGADSRDNVDACGLMRSHKSGGNLLCQIQCIGCAQYQYFVHSGSHHDRDCKQWQLLSIMQMLHEFL